MAKALTIGQVAAATGVAPRTIRYYEQVGVLPSPPRTRSGYRQYDERGIERLLFVQRARALRLPLHHVRALTATLDGVAKGAMRPRLLALVRAQLAAVRGRIAELGLLREELERVLRRLPSASRDGHGCRCLEAPDEPRREARVPGQSPAARLRRRG